MLNRKLSLKQGLLLYILVVVVVYTIIVGVDSMSNWILPHYIE